MMKYKDIFLSLLVVLCHLQLLSQSRIISGTVFNKDGESLDQVIITTKPASTNHTTSNAYGYFSLTIPAEADSIVFLYLGYKTKVLSISNVDFQNPTIIYLDPFTFEEVVVQSSTLSSNFNRNSLDISRLKTLPFLMGEADPMKAFLRFPGVQGGLEGSASLHVRGGSADQNLLLLDDAVVYNANHIFGFLSIFNSNVIKSADLYKSGFQAKYGGRLSSVIDVRLREGSRDTTRQKLSLGIISSDYMREGPFGRKKGSYLFSFRVASLLPASLIQRSLYASGQVTDLITYNMFDGNIKLNYDVNQKDKIYLSLYFSNDRMVGRYKSFSGAIDEDKTKLGWGNFSISTRYTHPIGKKSFLNGILYKSDYNFKLSYQTVEGGDASSYSNNFAQYNSIIDFGIKTYLTTQISPIYTLQYGIEQSNYRNTPTEQISYTIEDSKTDTLFQRTTYSSAAGFAAYIHNILNVGKFSVEAGLRASLFANHFTTIKYVSLEPRFSILYRYSKQLEFSLSFDQMFQPVQSLNSTGSGLPYETWVLSGDNIKPSLSKTFSGGTRLHWLNEKIKTEINGYYREFNNLNELIGRGFFIIPPNFDFDAYVATEGHGRAWGLEVSNQIIWKGIKCELNYTYSKSWRWFSAIDNGQQFPYSFDRRHVFLASVDLTLIRGWKMNVTYEFQTGPPIDLPVSRGIDQFGNITYLYGQKNAYRLPVYHRMDVAFYHSKTGRKNRIHEWSFGIYNVLSQKNPYFLRLKTKSILDSNQQPIGLKPYVEQVSLFRFLPYVKYSVSF